MSERTKNIIVGIGLALIVAMLLASCGGKAARPQVRNTVDGHRCTPQNEALQCILPAAPHKALQAPRAVARGIDFAWGAPSAGTARVRYGAQFGASYMSHDPSKGWIQRPGLVGEYHRAGLATVAVWETTANRAGRGFGAGRSDALEARAQAAAIGNTASTIYFAIDFDASGGQVDGYFRGVHSILGGRAGAYGGYRPLGYLCAHGLIGKAWQTYAWSHGLWLPPSCAPLEQYLNDSSVDYDRAVAPDYGQWPAPTSSKAAKRAALARERRLIAVRHRLIDRHHCRKGPPWFGHAKPASYHTACGHWLRRGARNHINAARLERELRS